MNNSENLTGELKTVEDILKELDEYVYNVTEELRSKVKDFSKKFKDLNDKIKLDATRISELDNQTIQEEELAKESAPSTPISIRNEVRYPNYVSPSIREPNFYKCGYDEDFEETYKKSLVVIFSSVKGLLTKLLYNSRAVLVLRETVKESEKLLDDLVQDENRAPFSDSELRLRLISEVGVTKEKIHKIFFEFTSQQKLKLIQQTKKLTSCGKKQQKNYESPVKKQNNVSPLSPLNRSTNAPIVNSNSSSPVFSSKIPIKRDTIVRPLKRQTNRFK